MNHIAARSTRGDAFLPRMQRFDVLWDGED